MNSRFYALTFLVLVSYLGFSQHAMLCPEQETYMKIEETNNVPNVSDNGNGTITLTHTESYITDIFANYVIYNFYRTYPNSTSESSKYYTISFKSKDLINELQASVSTSIFIFDFSYETTPIGSDIINFLDGKKFRLKDYCSIADNIGEPCSVQIVPEDIDIILSFNYNSTSELLLIESFNETPCGNTISIALMGGTENNSLQLWESTPGIITETDYLTDSCHNIEAHLYSMLDIACFNENIGNLIPEISIEENTLFLIRQNMVFGYHTATFEEFTLTTQESSILNELKLYEIEGNPYLQLSLNNTEAFSATIYSTSGKLILNEISLKNDAININRLSSGLYFIKVIDSNNQSKVFKFLKK